jgi:16S rRNA A1518/A1519 N6-dimethyltransferase RsmA/KsgA/DIM1 with predicted DNA glycosylase/AP lyase activity
MPWLVVFLPVVAAFGLGALVGAPFLPLRKPDIEPMLDLADLKPGQHLLDLGSGDGRLLVAAARRGARATGYEINPWLWLYSWVKTRKYRKLIAVHCGSYWRADWPKADVVTVFLIGHYMKRLDRELEARLNTPTKVVSYAFSIPGRRPIASNKNTYLYNYHY